MSSRLATVTPKFIRRHNLRCFGRIFLWALGSLAVFLVIFLFVWVIASLLTGVRELTIPVVIGGAIFAGAAFLAGHFHLKLRGPQDWDRLAQKPDRKPGMRLSRLSNQEYGQIGQGLLGLILAGPDWIGRISEECRAVIPASPEVAGRLEELRQHLAARDAWVPLKDFESYQDDIRLLARLNIVAIRELAGEWHFHVTVQGAARRTRGSERG